MLTRNEAASYDFIGFLGSFGLNGIQFPPMLEGLKKGKSRPPRIPPLPTGKAQEVLALALTGKPVAAAQWNCRTMARQVGISTGRQHQLKPRQVKGLKVSNGPPFAEKLRDVV
ncbi:hypothetical protein [Methyloglobulus sp.]|uniref:hypothetical protein n=1 Tax=Methyloglobulus sp. TaxID=2518622 RepID=UPI003989FDB1